MMKQEFYRRASNGEGQLTSYSWTIDSPKGIVQFIHDESDHANRYELLAERLNAQGYDVYANDIIGHGMSKQGHPGCFGMKDGAFQFLVDDTETLYEYAENRSGEGLPRILIGIGLGGLIALEYSEQHPELRELIVIGTMTVQSPIRMSMMVANNHVRRHGYSSVSDSLRTTILSLNDKADEEYYWVSSDPKQVQGYINDPDCGVRLAASAYREIIRMNRKFRKKDGTKNIPNIPILILSGEQDQLGICGRAANTLSMDLNRTGHGDVDLTLYKECYHDILHDKCAERVLSSICLWMDQKLVD